MESQTMERIEQLEFDIQGMTCDACALNLESALKEVPDVQQVEVPGWESGHASVVLEGEVDSRALSFDWRSR